jgi:hypothetical protein
MIRIFALPAAIMLAAAGGSRSAATQDWAGAYVGGQIRSLDDDTSATGGDTVMTYGLQLGYPRDLGNGVVLGAELE